MARRQHTIRSRRSSRSMPIDGIGDLLLAIERRHSAIYRVLAELGGLLSSQPGIGRASTSWRRGVFRYDAVIRVLREWTADENRFLSRRRKLSRLVEHIVAAAVSTNPRLDHRMGFEYDRVSRQLCEVIVDRIETNECANDETMGYERPGCRLGIDIAATHGAVVFRCSLYELIQYAPRTPTVDAGAILWVPPQAHKYYLLDLAPGRSLIGYALDRGQQVFTLSWFNPTAAQRCYGLADYVAAVDQAIDMVFRITENHPIKLAGMGAGGLVAIMTLAKRRDEGRSYQVAGLAVFETVCEAPSDARGVVDHSDIAWAGPAQSLRLFDAPDRYRERTSPYKASLSADLVYWYRDRKRISMRMRADLLTIYRHRRLTTNGLTLGRQALDITVLTDDIFMLAGVDDMTPWHISLALLRQLDGRKRFVLARASGAHAMMCPPNASGRISNHRIIDRTSSWNIADGPATTPIESSWWPDWIAWCHKLTAHTYEAPRYFGNDEFKPIDAAPGRYIRQR